MVKKINEIAGCGCGRSPTGKCMGWHGLSEDDFRVKLAEYEARKLAEANEAKTNNGKD